MNNKRILLWCSGLLSLLLVGCQEKVTPPTLLMAQPKQITFQDEIQIARLSELLEQPDLKPSDQVKLLYQRGMLYDSLGFRSYAQSDITQMLEIDPTIADAYNFLGMIASSQQQYDAAYEAFNIALELDPKSEYAYFNRAIALYRGQRFSSAQQDMFSFYQFAPNDPFRILWLYLVEKQLNSAKAIKDLAERYQALSDKQRWGSDLIAFYLGKIDQTTLFDQIAKQTTDNQQLAEHLCETYFYLGKYYLDKGNKNIAEQMFKLALSNNIYNFIEHLQALQELKLLHSNDHVPVINEN